MDWLLSAIEAMPLAQYLRTARWGYAAVNTTHVLGIALVVGAIMPLNLRLLGFWPSVPLAPLAQLLVPIAAAGLLLTVAAGALLFSVRAEEYAGLAVFKVKLALVGLHFGRARSASCSRNEVGGRTPGEADWSCDRVDDMLARRARLWPPYCVRCRLSKFDPEQSPLPLP